MTRRLVLTFICAAFLCFANFANAQTFDGNNDMDGGDGVMWEDAFNWAGDALPGGNANIGDGFTGVTLSSSQAIGELDVAGDQTSGDGGLNHSAGALTGSGWMKIGGDGSTGTYDINGGASASGFADLFVGFNGGTGNLNISDTASVTANGQFRLATQGGGTGNLNVSGGTLQVDNFNSGGSNSTATINQTAGVVNSNNWVAISNFNDGTGTATYNISGGRVTANNGNLAIGQEGEGTLNVSGTAVVQQLGVGNIFVGGGNAGASGDGTLNITGSLAAVSGLNLLVAETANHTGEINWVADTGGITTIILTGDAITGAGGAATFGAGVSTLSLDLSADPLSSVAGTEYVLVDGIAGVAGTFTGIGEGDIVNFTGGVGAGTISYVGGDGFDIVLTVIPEPSSAILLGIGVIGLISRRRRS